MGERSFFGTDSKIWLNSGGIRKVDCRGKRLRGGMKKMKIFLHKDIDFRLLALYIYSPLEKAQASKSDGL